MAERRYTQAAQGRGLMNDTNRWTLSFNVMN